MVLAGWGAVAEATDLDLRATIGMASKNDAASMNSIFFIVIEGIFSYANDYANIVNE